MKAPKVLLTGYYGFGNFGDDIFVYVMSREIEEILGGKRVTILSKPIPGVISDFAVPSWFPDSIYRNAGLLGAVVRMIFTFFAILKIDILVNAGGSVFEVDSGSRMPRFLALMKRYLKFRWFAIGVSIPAKLKSEKKLIEVLSKVDAILLRDGRSTLNMKDASLSNCNYSGDLAALLYSDFGSSFFERESHDFDLMISASNHIPIEKMLVDIKELIGNSDIKKCCVLSLNPLDYSINTAIVSELRSLGVFVEYYQHKSISTTCEFIVRSKYIVTSRLHGAIFSYVANRPFFLYPHHEKCRAFLEDIDVDIPSLERIEFQKTESNNYIEWCDSSVKWFLDKYISN